MGCPGGCTESPNFLRLCLETRTFTRLAERLPSLHETLASIPAVHTLSALVQHPGSGGKRIRSSRSSSATQPMIHIPYQIRHCVLSGSLQVAFPLE